MNEGAKYITILCGEFGDGYQPLTRAAFWKIMRENNDSIENVIASDRHNVIALLKRSGSVAFAISKLEEMGIKITTVLDDDYPQNLHKKLGDKRPPMLYYSGDSGIARRRHVGYVGSRNVDDADRAWTSMMVAKNTESRYGVVSGGARGIDVISTGHALSLGNCAIEFLADGLERRIKERETLSYILDGRLLLYSATSPLARGNRNSFVAAAMERNKFIYAQSSGTVVVKSGLEEGGTWAGATEALKNNWCKVYVWDQKGYPGNQALIERGATGLGDNGEITSAFSSPLNGAKSQREGTDNSALLTGECGNAEDKAKYEQITMFGVEG